MDDIQVILLKKIIHMDEIQVKSRSYPIPKKNFFFNPYGLKKLWVHPYGFSSIHMDEI